MFERRRERMTLHGRFRPDDDRLRLTLYRRLIAQLTSVNNIRLKSRCRWIRRSMCNTFGAKSIRRVLRLAARGYRRHAAQLRHPSRCCAREIQRGARDRLLKLPGSRPMLPMCMPRLPLPRMSNGSLHPASTHRSASDAAAPSRCLETSWDSAARRSQTCCRWGQPSHRMTPVRYEIRSASCLR
jgi:hypothetical protein